MSASPSQQPKLTMDFFDALRQVADGRVITKLAWENKEIQVLIAETMIKGSGFARVVCLRKPNGEDISGEKILSTAPFFVSEGDMSGADWVVVD